MLSSRLKPAKGFAYFFHLLLNLLVPAGTYVLVRINFVQIALALILLSKWRMFAVRPRHWPANVRANSIDLIIGISFLIFMTHATSSVWQLIWAGGYGIWLTLLKRFTSTLGISLQAMLGQFLGLMALFLAFSGSSSLGLLIGAWAIAYSAARHFLSSFDEPLTPMLSYFWAFFAASMTWVLSHWLLFYPGRIALPTFLLTFIGYGLSTLYYLHETDRLSRLVRRQIVLVMLALITVVLAFSDWGDKAI